MKVLDALSSVISQQDFAAIIGVSEARVSQLVTEGTLNRGGTAIEWIAAYCERLREQAAGRMGSTVGGLDPAQESAALKRSQREGQDYKNAIARKEFAPISLLSEVLAAASQSVVERFEQLPGALKKACPDMTDAQRDQVMTVLSTARNEWVRATSALVVAKADEQDIETEVIDA